MYSQDLFFDQMKEYVDDYESHLLKSVSEATASKHSHILYMFLRYAIHNCKATRISTITYHACGSQFVKWFNQHTNDNLQLSTSKNTVRKFFEYLADRYQIINVDILKKLQKKKKKAS